MSDSAQYYIVELFGGKIMANNNQENNNVNGTVNNAANQGQPEQPAKQKPEKVPYKVGPITIELNPKVAKVLKFVGIGTIVVGAVAVGSKIGGSVKGKQLGNEISARDSEIARLQALLDDSPALIETAAETVTDVVPEVVDTISE